MNPESLRASGSNQRRVGTFVAVGDIALAEALAATFDVLVIDLEHGSLDTGQAQGLTIAIQAHHSVALVRMASSSDPRIAAVLDSGADGVVAPMVESEDEAMMFVEQTRYPPSGKRGFGPRRAGTLGRQGAPHEGQPLCAVQIESEAGVAAARAIAAVDGLDMIVLGCSDLAVSLGTPGQFETAAIHEAIVSVAAVAQESGRTFALAAGGEISRLAAVVPVAVDLLLHGVDLRLYVQAAESSSNALRDVVAELGVARRHGSSSVDEDTRAAAEGGPDA